MEPEVKRGELRSRGLGKGKTAVAAGGSRACDSNRWTVYAWGVVMLAAAGTRRRGAYLGRPTVGPLSTTRV